MNESIQSINVMAELDRMGIRYDLAGDEELKVCCPAHSDSTPSASVNTTTGLWKCHTAGCGATGDFITFMSIALKTTRALVTIELSKRYNLQPEDKTIDSELVERYHSQVWQAGPLLKALRDRGISDDTLRLRKIGLHENRITIPIKNEHGRWVNVRKYLPGAPGPDKMRNVRGHGAIRLYPLDQLEFDRIVVTGGEMKALVIAQHLNRFGIGSVCATGGEENWKPEFSLKLKKKHVWVCMDVDQPGKSAAQKVCAQIRQHAAWVGDVKLDLDVDRYPHGDPNDYFGQELRTGEDFLALLNSTPEWTSKSDMAVEDEAALQTQPLEVTISQATKSELTGRRIALKCVVQAMEETPYIVPETVACDCSRDQANCANCPVYAMQQPSDGFVTLTISPESPAIIEMVNSGRDTQKTAIRDALKIPQCKAVTFRTTKFRNVQQVHVTPVLDVSSHVGDANSLSMLCVSHGMEVGTTYDVVGRTFPHPRTQAAVMLASSVKAAEDALSSYRPSEDELSDLDFFKPSEWTVDAMQARLDAYYDDIEANVTRIFKRRDLHVFTDLAYCSPLWIRFDGKEQKGWVEVLFIGDSSQGKSETVIRMQQHFGLGGKVECKNASGAGLIGGLQQYGNKWLVTRGMIPRYDRQLVVLEELKGTSVENIARLTDMRSSGVAEIDKIEKRRFFSRTRVIAISNPRSEMPISSYSYGVDAARELIGSPEDLRRFDAVFVVSAGQVPVDEMNRLTRHRPVVEPVHTPDLCQRRVLWAWTRSVDQVAFADDATTLILDTATDMCNRYTEAIPLVDRGSMRYKLARLAASAAMMTASFGPTRQDVLVRPCHVQWVAQLLDRVYSEDASGYADFSRAYEASRHLKDGPGIITKLCGTPFPIDLVENLLHTDSIELRDLCDWTGWDRSDTVDLLSMLVRNKALQRTAAGYRKTPEFISLLKKALAGPQLKAAARPDHVEETLGKDVM